MDGLSFKVARCADVLDAALIQLNLQTKALDKIIAWNKRGAHSSGPLSLPTPGRLIVELTEAVGRDGKTMWMAQAIRKTDEKETAPVVFFRMQSLSLDIPMRLEVPLRALIKGGAKLEGSYVVYLHALLTNDGKAFTYYGITKRGWSVRFVEHTKSAMKAESRRLFPLKLNELVSARVAERKGEIDERPKLAGIVSSLCAVGLNEDAALDTEEYLVDKYSLSSKHPAGLNMIPGGREGIRVLHTLIGDTQIRLVDTESRDATLGEYLKSHPQLGIPKPGVAEKWNDPAYAEAVICGRQNRLTADQVREIRYLAATGLSTEQIAANAGALDNAQVFRVLDGRTYARIR